MNIINVLVDNLIPYENNPRHNDSAVDAVASSIKEFGFKVPIVIDKNHVIINGHTRLKAAKKLGLQEVPCIIADDLNEDQTKAFRLADNKVSELAEWDLNALESELEALKDFNMESFGFDELEAEIGDIDSEMEDDGYYGDERERTFEAYKLSEFNEYRADGKYQMPIIKAEDYIPERLIGFNYVLTKEDSEAAVHFYLDDYQFERIWNDPYKYIDKLRKFGAVLTPDFSLYMDMPMAMKIWNVYRSRLVGQVMQDHGLIVIPTIQWAEKETFEFCFDGLQKGGVISVSTIGVKRDEDAYNVWVEGMNETIKQLEPSHVLVYGGELEGYQFDVPATFYDNQVLKRWT